MRGGLTWTHLVSLGLTWTHLASLGLTWTPLDSLSFTWSHLVSLGLTLVCFSTREKGKARGGKGKGKAAGLSFDLDLTRQRHRAYARTHDTKRFPGWTHPPTSHIYIPSRGGLATVDTEKLTTAWCAHFRPITTSLCISIFIAKEALAAEVLQGTRYIWQEGNM